MPTVRSLLEERLRAALDALSLDSSLAEVTPSADGRFGDYQSNAAMVLAKRERKNPRELGQAIAEKIDVSGLAEPPTLAGAGFLNFRLTAEFLDATATAHLADERGGVSPVATPRTIVIDFSSPNVAKPMHVGHIRSTILGDSLARVARFLGHHVVTDNHIGDWGTQFGMLLYGWKTELNQAALDADPLGEMERIYKHVSAACKADPVVLDHVRHELVQLQAGESKNLALWHEMIRLSQSQFDTIYGRLDISFDVTLGESFYNPRLKPVVEELKALGIASESDGAWCVFSDGATKPEDDPFLVKDKDGWRPNPALVQKSDGAANYTTTDLATLEYRLETWSPDEIVYVTDGRQQLHFRQLFAIFRRWRPDTAVHLAHAWFGSILGEDGKPFKTRSGDTIKLSELLDEAEERAFAAVTEKNPALPEAERREIARVVGLGAVKYADLSPHRQTDYVFSWDKMLSFQGNTAPYLQYSYVRIRSIFRKAGEAGIELAPSQVSLVEPSERALAIKLLLFGEVLPQVLADFRPNLLATYLYELASTFHGFFEACPVLKSEGATRASRLALCELTARTLRTGLGLLGIQCPERM
ncbi:MAG TPA: arginine--tRNA ligase [Chthoniobacterales bacterium]